MTAMKWICTAMVAALIMSGCEDHAAPTEAV